MGSAPTGTGRPTDDVVVRVRGAFIGFPGAWRLGPFDLEIARGTFWGIVGPNGAGKTTLLKSLVGLHPPLSGTIDLAESVRARGGISYVPQSGSLDPIFPVSAVGVVMMGLAPRRGFARPFVGRHRKSALQALERVGLVHLARSPFRHLSGGEQQRVLLARAIVSEPAVMLLDEPTAAMDVDAERAILDLVRGLVQDRGVSVLMVSHMLPSVRRHADRVVLVNRERQQVIVGSAEEILGETTNASGDSFLRIGAQEKEADRP